MNNYWLLSKGSLDFAAQKQLQLYMKSSKLIQMKWIYFGSLLSRQ